MGTDEDCQLLGHVFVGGAITALDVAPDNRSFVVGTDAGTVTTLVLGAAPSANLVATLPVVDTARTCFFRTFAPLRW